jgi:hypothetical protein
MDCGVSPTTVGRLVAAGAPFGLLLVLRYIHIVAGPFSRGLDLLELFSGHGELINQYKHHGLRARGFDINRDSMLEDMCTSVGFNNAIMQVLRLQQHSLLWAGVPCSSFTWLNRGTSGRNKDNPVGNTAHECVRKGNLCSSRSVLLAMLAFSRNAWWAAENPGSSCILDYPRWIHVFLMSLLRKIPAVAVVRCWMAGYNHFSAKPTILWGDLPQT